LAGLKTGATAVIEPHGLGYGKFAKRPIMRTAAMKLERPVAGRGMANGIHDARSIKRPQLSRDKALASLL
jgi:hypothetical protein